MMNLPKEVTIWEVGPRDGLQNEPARLSTEQKIAWINSLTESGLTHIEVSSFVSPRWIPQLADAAEVFAGIQKKAGVVYSALVPNQQGLERALNVGVKAVAVFMSASETHNKKNINKTIDETFPVLRDVTRTAKMHQAFVRGYVSTVFGCPYEGEVSAEQVLRVALALLDDGVDEISLGDTIGVATPLQTERVLDRLLKEIPAERLALHMHNTRGTALANLLVGLTMGITKIDSALGGLGGCPYAPGASGNVATDDVLYMLQGSGIQTGIDEGKLLQSLELLQNSVGHALNSHASKVHLAQGGDHCVTM
ncbi:hydroxymethylglutaryl-CoA lyase [Sulfoacidibacillus thermotolerans]|uniref:Hydroxymethylglutaryl-CoA lyase n=1 Tax=Sulfoacidibacillus thermotolerans TaxID=1765684 RepID=A0A2U3D8W3_SULT2|nr:hydroxymethylglutaryl-CoA lyase [Sulfoacidibacillus thermotolerans]PWI57718.1 hydroxymethylglutaryl-CoA lyase [Sulfoacidibacillus thermotolerans]